MSNETVNKLLKELHEQVADDLLRRVKSGEASPAELQAAIKFLRDNGIEAMPTPENPLGALASQLPDFLDQDEQLQ